ncbi:hypothetical protein TNCV_1801641 [Trichonephila clavipes]|nr:hypothetical protein TNCV_1801641 [Trichonephila clavipes]
MRVVSRNESDLEKQKIELKQTTVSKSSRFSSGIHERKRKAISTAADSVQSDAGRCGIQQSMQSSRAGAANQTETKTLRN